MMKNLHLSIQGLLLFLFFTNTSYSQINVSVTGNTNTSPNLAVSYTSLNDALTALNAVTSMSGAVTLTCNAGSETAPSATGFTLGSASLNPVLSATNTISIVASGTVTLNAAVGASTPSSASPDGIFKIVGADYITINGLTFNDGNTTNPASMEYGLALFKAGVDDGSQNNTISNCIFNMDRNNFATGTTPMVEGSVGILIINSTPTAATTVLTPTVAAGTNSFNKIYGNTTNGGNYGIVLSGFAASTPFTLGDTSNDIGGNSISTGNTIRNYGGGTAASNPSAGIRANNQWSINISYNNVDNNNGGGLAHPNTLRGIFAQAGVSANATIRFNTVSLKGGGTTSQLTGIDVGIGSTAASNTVTVENNTVQNSTYTTATSGTFRAIAVSASPATLNVNSNTVTNNVIPGTGQYDCIIMSGTPNTYNCNFNTVNLNIKTGTGTFHGIYASGSSATMNVLFRGNTINNNQIQAANGTLYCMRGTTSLYTVRENNANNNKIINTSSTSASSVFGYSNAGSPTSESIFENDIYDLSIEGAGTSTASSITGINLNTSSSSVKNINNNRIRNLQFLNSSTGAATIIGISQSLATTASIYSNKIYDLIATNGAASLVRGIQISSGSTTNVYNNLIGNLQASASTSGDALRGINITSTTTLSNLNISYNSIYINGTSSGSGFGSQGLFHTYNATASTASLIMKNNIIANTSTPSGAGITSAFRRSSSTDLNNYNTSSNNNLFYAGTPSATNLIYTDGTNNDQTLAAFKSRVSPRESVSISEAPNFTSLVGSSSDFLHINTSIATQIESGGVTISGLSSDFDGDARNATTPDIGADEFSGIGIDLSAPSITYTTLANTGCLVGTTLTNVLITDVTGVNILSGTRPRLYYKKTTNTNTYADNTNGTNGWKYVEADGVGSSPFTFTFDFTLLSGGGGIAVGDTIQYFVVAQDLVMTPNIAINSGTFAAAASSVALSAAQFPLTGTINKFVFVNPLNGAKTIGASGDYPTLTGIGGLFEAVNNLGIATNLTATILDAAVTEPGTVALNSIAYAGCTSGPFTLTIKPNTTSVLSGAVSSGALIKLNGADNVVIDGSNSGGMDKSLTITNTSTTAPTVVSVVSLGTNNGATNNTIKNCNISTGIATSIGYGISIGGNTPGTPGDDNDYTTIQNNSITLAPIGIYATGNASGTNTDLNIIGNSVVYNGTLASLGIQVGQATNSLISQNTIDEQTSASQSPTGISLETGFVNSSVTKNNITKAMTTATGGYGGRGITVGTGSASSNLTIANNFISGINGSNWTVFGNSSSMGIGIGMIGSSSTITTIAGGINIYHNSVNLYGDYQGTSTTTNKITAALYVGTGATSLDVKNNIFVNSLNNPNAVASAYAIYSAAANTAFTGIDFNDYFVSGAQGVLGFIGSNRTDLAGIIAGFGQNASSTNSDPKYLSNSNLHINPASATIVEGNGTPLASVTTDIDNDARNVTTPDIGADEGTFIELIANDVQATSFIDPINGGSKPTGVAFTPMASFTNNGTNTQTNIPVRYRVLNASMVEIYNETGTIASLVSGASFTHTFPSITLATVGTYTIFAKAELVGDELTSNDEITGTLIGDLPLCGTYAVGSSQPVGFQNLTQAFSKINALGVSCAVVFELQSDYTSVGETLPLTLTNIPGISAINTFTLKPATGVNSTITGSINSNVIIKVLSDYVIIDGSNNNTTSRNLNLINTASTGPSVVLIGSIGTSPRINVTLKNCNVTNGLNTSTAVAVTDATVLGNDGYFNNITVQNNLIKNAYIGIYSRAFVSAGNGSGLNINNNDLSSSGSDAIRFTGIYLQGIDGGSVANNLIGNFNTASDEDDNGIFLATGVKNISVLSNKISNLGYTGINGYGAHGILVSSGVLAANILVANNMISNMYGDGWSYTAVAADNPIGIALTSTQDGISIYHNSINLSGNTLNQSGAMSMGIFLNTGSVADIRNNIIVNNLGLTGATGYGSVGIYAATANTQFTDINYNNYICNPTGTGAKYTGQISTTGSALLSDWQTATTKDANSVSINPVFTSATDLHLIPESNITLNNLGTPIALVTTDIDNDTRNVTTPDIGCDEYTPMVCEGQPSAGTVSPGTISLCNGLTTIITATGISTGSGISYQWKTGPAGGPYTNVTGGSGATTASYTTPTLTIGTYYYVLETTCANSMQNNLSNEVTVTVNPNPTASISPTGPTNICQDQTQTFTASTDLGNSYAWKRNNVIIGGATASSYGATLSGDYKVIVSIMATGCKDSSAVSTLVVNPKPSSLLISPSSSDGCNGSIIPLEATGGLLTVTDTIGTGTSSNTLSTPYKGFWGGHKVQFLYTASELMAAGLAPASQITTVGMSISTFTSPYTFNGFTIAMKNTSSTALTATLETGTSTVLNPTNYVLSGTAPFNVSHILNTPFTWDGTSNLIVEYCFNNNNGGGVSGNSASVNSHTAAGNYTSYYSADNTADVCSNPLTATTSTTRPNITLSYTNTVSKVWSPATGLYTDAGATIAYLGENLNNVYAKPSMTTNYTVTATSAAGCTSSASVNVQITGDEVMNENNAGTGSLRKAIECTAAGDTVFVSSGSVNLINLLTQLNVDKPLLILDDNGSPVMLKFDFGGVGLMNETNGAFKVGTMGNVTLDNIHIKHVGNDATHPIVKNEGILTLKNSKITGETGNIIPPVVQNATGATINAEGTSEIKSE